MFYGVTDIGLFFAVTAEQLGQVGEVQGSADATTSDSQQLAQQSHLQAAAVSIQIQYEMADLAGSILMAYRFGFVAFYLQSVCIIAHLAVPFT